MEIKGDSYMLVEEKLNKDNAPPSEFGNLGTLLFFQMYAYYKGGQFFGARFGDKIIYAVIILSLYSGIGNNIHTKFIQSTSSLLRFIYTLCVFGAAPFVPILTLELSLYY